MINCAWHKICMIACAWDMHTRRTSKSLHWQPVIFAVDWSITTPLIRKEPPSTVHVACISSIHSNMPHACHELCEATKLWRDTYCFSHLPWCCCWSYQVGHYGSLPLSWYAHPELRCSLSAHLFNMSLVLSIMYVCSNRRIFQYCSSYIIASCKFRFCVCEIQALGLRKLLNSCARLKHHALAMLLLIIYQISWYINFHTAARHRSVIHSM